MKEILISANYNNGSCSYLVEKEICDSNISVVIYDVWNGRHTEKKKIQYKNIGEEYQSPLLTLYIPLL